MHSSPTPTDEPREQKVYHLATCPDCGGRGGTYDDEGNWHKCYRCNGTGQSLML